MEYQNDFSEMIALQTCENIVLKVPKVTIPNLDRQMLKIVVDTMYASNVKLDYPLAWQLLHLATKFNLDFLINTCLTYLSQKIAMKNCVLLFLVGLRFKHQLGLTAYRYILIHFVKVNFQFLGKFLYKTINFR